MPTYDEAYQQLMQQAVQGEQGAFHTYQSGLGPSIDLGPYMRAKSQLPVARSEEKSPFLLDYEQMIRDLNAIGTLLGELGVVSRYNCSRADVMIEALRAIVAERREEAARHAVDRASAPPVRDNTKPAGHRW